MQEELINSENKNLQKTSVDLTKPPFNLSNEDIEWVNKTKENMTIDEKIGQLIFMMGAQIDKNMLEDMAYIKPGGMMLRQMKAKDALKGHLSIQKEAKIPLFLAANLEAGGNGIIEEGTEIGNQMIVAATNNVDNAFKLGEACMKEAKAVGGNMAFAPLLDVNFNFENPIANIRCFGDDVQRITDMGKAYVNGVQNSGGSVTLKHFPGDGVDGRDQHVIKTVNSLSFDDWNSSFGKIYKENILNGATGVMTGHIAFPAYFDEKGITNEDRMTPGSLSETLIKKLLREDLDFNGLIMTDSSLMVGFGAEGKREDLVPRCISAGNDMLLFTKNAREDFKFMMRGYENGIITTERLNEALDRILGLKAMLGLHKTKKTSAGNFKDIGSEKHIEWAKNVADEGITLVKNTENILPLSVEKNKKIGLIFLGSDEDIFEKLADSKSTPAAIRLLLKFKKKKQKNYEKFIEKMTGKGFEFEVIDMSDLYGSMKYITQSIEDFKNSYDLIMYFVSKQTMSNQTNLRLEYRSLGGFDAPWFVNEIPTMMISVGNPYHQYDLENVNTVVNCYTGTDFVIDALVEKLIGESEFKGVSPVKLEFEPFTGDISKWK